MNLDPGRGDGMTEKKKKEKEEKEEKEKKEEKEEKKEIKGGGGEGDEIPNAVSDVCHQCVIRCDFQREKSNIF